MLAFTAGIMMSALTMGLIPEALSIGRFFPLAAGIILGILVLTILEKNIPHLDLEHSRKGIEFVCSLLQQLSFIIYLKASQKVLVMHRIQDTGNRIAFAIGLQNPLMVTSYIEFLVPYGLSFAAGAMLFIIYKELIPESHGDGNERISTYWGFYL